MARVGRKLCLGTWANVGGVGFKLTAGFPGRCCCTLQRRFSPLHFLASLLGNHWGIVTHHRVSIGLYVLQGQGENIGKPVSLLIPGMVLMPYCYYVKT